jgi:hypothetical protein
VLAEGIEQKLISPDHFSCDGTLIRSLASHKSLQPIEAADRKDDDTPPEGGGRDVSVDWRGERRTNATHRSTTDPEARLARKGIRRNGNGTLHRPGTLHDSAGSRGSHVATGNITSIWLQCT